MGINSANTTCGPTPGTNFSFQQHESAPDNDKWECHRSSRPQDLNLAAPRRRLTAPRSRPRLPRFQTEMQRRPAHAAGCTGQVAILVTTTCPPAAGRACPGKVRFLEQPQRLGLLLV